MYSYGSKIQCMHGERSSSHLGPEFSHSPPHSSEATTVINFLTKLTECLMNDYRSNYKCVCIYSYFLPFLHKRRYTTHLILCLWQGVKEGCALFVDRYLCYRARAGERRTGLHCAVAGTWLKTRHGIQFCWLSILDPSHHTALLLDQLFAHASEYYWSTGRLLGSSLSS